MRARGRPPLSEGEVATTPGLFIIAHSSSSITLPRGLHSSQRKLLCDLGRVLQLPSRKCHHVCSECEANSCSQECSCLTSRWNNHKHTLVPVSCTTLHSGTKITQSNLLMHNTSCNVTPPTSNQDCNPETPVNTSDVRHKKKSSIKCYYFTIHYL